MTAISLSRAFISKISSTSSAGRAISFFRRQDRSFLINLRFRVPSSLCRTWRQSRLIPSSLNQNISFSYRCWRNPRLRNFSRNPPTNLLLLTTVVSTRSHYFSPLSLLNEINIILWSHASSKHAPTQATRVGFSDSRSFCLPRCLWQLVS
jgi:hypothetical protein